MATFDGEDLNNPVPLKTPTISYPISNFPQLIQYTQEYAQKAGKYQVPAYGISHHLYSNAVLVAEGTPTNMGGGLVSFSREFIQLPNEPFKEPVTISYTFPGYKVRRSWKYTYTRDGSRQLEQMDNQVIREPRTMTIIGRKETEFINLLSPQYAQTTTSPQVGGAIRYGGSIFYPNRVDSSGTWIYYNGENTRLEDLPGNFEPLVAPPNGFDFSQVQIEPAFQPKATADVFNKSGSLFYYYGMPIQQEPTDYVYDINSTPTAAAYKRMVDIGDELQVETTMLEQFRGTIYTKTRTFVKAL